MGFKNTKDKILSDQIGNLSVFVTPDMYFTVGEADYTVALQNAIADCKANNKILSGENGKVYSVSQPLTIDFPIRVDFNNATIKATQLMDSIIKIESTTRIAGLKIANLSLDGNAKSNYGLNVSTITDSTFESINAINSIVAEIYVRKGSIASNQLTFEKIRCRRNSILAGTENCVALKINEQDNWFNDIITVSYKTHIDHQSGVNWFHEVHGWNGSICNSFFTDTVFMIVNSETVMTNCNCSNIAIAYKITSNALVRITHSNIILRYTVNNATVTTFYIDTGITNCKVKVSGTYIEGLNTTVNRLCNIEPTIGMFIFDGSNNIPTSLMSVFGTFVDGYRTYGTTDVTNTGSNTVTTLKGNVDSNNMVTLSFSCNVPSTTAGTRITLFTLPTGLKPAAYLYDDIWLKDNVGYKERSLLEINSAGDVMVTPITNSIASGAGANFRGSLSYPRA